jgi:hypothetical protein
VAPLHTLSRFRSVCGVIANGIPAEILVWCLIDPTVDIINNPCSAVADVRTLEQEFTQLLLKSETPAPGAAIAAVGHIDIEALAEIRG